MQVEEIPLLLNQCDTQSVLGQLVNGDTVFIRAMFMISAKTHWSAAETWKQPKLCLVSQ